MGRWEPGARGRLQQAALGLYAERGYDRTTVAEIAERAGLTERTFFRHFADKREVLFSGSERLVEVFVGAVAAAAPGTAPMDAAAAGLATCGEFFAGRREHSGARQAVIEAHPALREREFVKMASLAGAVAAALRERGVGEPAATLVADSAVAVFRTAFARWLADDDGRELSAHLAESLAQLRELTAGGAPATAR